MIISVLIQILSTWTTVAEPDYFHGGGQAYPLVLLFILTFGFIMVNKTYWGC